MKSYFTFTQKSLAEQMRLTEREIEARKLLLDFGPEDAAALIACRKTILDSVDRIVSEFYWEQAQIKELSLLIGDADTFKRLHFTMRRYVIELFEGYYDCEYVNKRLRIGKVHQRIGISPKYYVSAIHLLESLLQKELAKNAETRQRKKAASALHKLILFDLQLVFDTYVSHLVAEVALAKEEAERYAESLENTVAERTRQLEQISRQDWLTNLHNQGSFYQELRREIAVASRQQQPLSLVYFDLDGFKEHNDKFGHRSGDEVLVHVAEALRETVRETDIPCRYGGDEFCIIVPGAGTDGAKQLCDRLIESFHRKKCPGVTFSIGISEFVPSSPVDSDQLIQKADRLMYQSKTKATSNPVSTSPRTYA